MDPTRRGPLAHAVTPAGDSASPQSPAIPAPQDIRLWHLALIAFSVALYAVLSHVLMVHATNAPWTVAVLFGPLWLALAAAGWRQRHALALASCVALSVVLAVVVWQGGVADVRRLYVLQHAGMHAALLLAFGLTLRHGSTALITTMAQALHQRLQQPFTPALHHYTRGLTLAWTLYFAAMIVISVVIYALAPWSVWSLFSNVVTPLSAALFFVGEYWLRYVRHPEFERLSMRAVIDAWRRA